MKNDLFTWSSRPPGLEIDWPLRKKEKPTKGHLMGMDSSSALHVFMAGREGLDHALATDLCG